MYLERIWLLGNLMHGMCKVFNILWCNSSHGNSAIFGQVNAVILCETFSLKNNPAISTVKLNTQLCNAHTPAFESVCKRISTPTNQLLFTQPEMAESSWETNNSVNPSEWRDEHCSSCCTLSLIRLYLDNIGSKCNRATSCLFMKVLALLWCGRQLLEIIY